MRIVRENSPEGLSADLEARLTEFNERHAGPLRIEQVGLSVRDPAGRLVAGLTGELFWNALHIDLLWVEPEHRLRGYGRSLLERAEGLARERGCDVVYLSSFEFQAPSFYAAAGYNVIGELPGVPKGSRRVWLSKLLAVDR